MSLLGAHYFVTTVHYILGHYHSTTMSENHVVNCPGCCSRFHSSCYLRQHLDNRPACASQVNVSGVDTTIPGLSTITSPVPTVHMTTVPLRDHHEDAGKLTTSPSIE